MRYFGGKNRIANEVASYLISVQNGKPFVEPFCGGLNITSKMSDSNKILAYDFNKGLISLYNAILNGWTPPDNLSEEEYRNLRLAKDLDNPLTAFAGFGCSFAGKWFGGYARDKTGGNYCRMAKNSILKKFTCFKNVNIIFEHKSFFDLDVEGTLIYCDPPYADTTSYTGTPAFDSKAFWEHVRLLSKKNIVVVSEYKAPEDFISVKEMVTKTDIRDKTGKKSPRIERLFKWKEAE